MHEQPSQNRFHITGYDKISRIPHSKKILMFNTREMDFACRDNFYNQNHHLLTSHVVA